MTTKEKWKEINNAMHEHHQGLLTWAEVMDIVGDLK